MGVRLRRRNRRLGGVEHHCGRPSMSRVNPDNGSVNFCIRIAGGGLW
jgi:hypothetical protein